MKTLADPACVREIVTRLRKLGPGVRPVWGRMSAPQMVCHLSDSYLGVMGLRPIKPAGTWVTRNVLRLAALRLPVPWPRGTPTMPEVDQLKFGTPPADFELDRARLEQLIGRFSQPAAQRDFVFAPHPVFGEMNDWEWMRWGYLHADHHLRQFGDATLLALSSSIPR